MNRGCKFPNLILVLALLILWSTELSIKCILIGSDDIRKIVARPDMTLHDLKKRIRRLYGHKMTLRYKDADGDMINIRKVKFQISIFIILLHQFKIAYLLAQDEDWTACLARFGTAEVRLELKQYEKALLHRNEAHVRTVFKPKPPIRITSPRAQFIHANSHCNRAQIHACSCQNYTRL